MLRSEYDYWDDIWQINMNKKSLIEMLQRVLKTDADLEFLLKLNIAELENLIACIRDRVENRSNES